MDQKMIFIDGFIELRDFIDDKLSEDQRRNT